VIVSPSTGPTITKIAEVEIMMTSQTMNMVAITSSLFDLNNYVICESAGDLFFGSVSGFNWRSFAALSTGSTIGLLVSVEEDAAQRRRDYQSIGYVLNLAPEEFLKQNNKNFMVPNSQIAQVELRQPASLFEEWVSSDARLNFVLTAGKLKQLKIGRPGSILLAAKLLPQIFGDRATIKINEALYSKRVEILRSEGFPDL
jgi:hypothetical protein